MGQINVVGVEYALSDGRVLLNDVSFRVGDGAKVALIGPNGAGKTTLFRLIRGEIGPESGEIQLSRGFRIGSVAQEAPGGPESLIETVLAADTERTALMAEAETAKDPKIGRAHV